MVKVIEGTIMHIFSKMPHWRSSTSSLKTSVKTHEFMTPCGDFAEDVKAMAKKILKKL